MAIITLITGAPGSGKSTLGRALAVELRVPFLARDDVRGGLAFTAGVWSDEFRAMPSGGEAVEVFVGLVEAMASNGVSCVIELVVRRNQLDVLERIGRAAELRVIRTSCVGALDRMAERHRNERLISNPNVLAVAGVTSPDEHTSLAVERMRRVVDDMLTEFPVEVPVLDIETTAGYDPPLEAIVEFVTALEQGER